MCWLPNIRLSLINNYYMIKTDLLIVGAGPGGYRAAVYAAQHGMKVIIIEASHVGGTCLNEGCIPTKSFVRNAEVMQTLKEANVFGLEHLQYNLNFERVVARKNEVVTALREGVESMLKHPNITVVRAEASFKDAKTVMANGVDYMADAIIVATGSKPKVLRLEQCKGRVLDSSDLLALDHLPQSLCIVGAGVIGMEFASIFNSFGVEVTVVEFMKECLPVLDADIAKRLRKVLEKRGVHFCLQCAVKSIDHGEVTFEDKKGRVEKVRAEEVLMAVGRVPRVFDHFKLAGFEYDERRGIVVDDNLQTTIPGIYAVGDVNGRQMLAHAAEMQGIHVVHQLLGQPDGMRLDIMPAAIYTLPEAACVGWSEDECKARGMEFVCRKSFWRSNGKAVAMNESEGMLKLLTSPDGTILGCHAYGVHAADLVQEVSVLMCRHTTVAELSEMVHIHPSLSEIVKAAAEV